MPGTASDVLLVLDVTSVTATPSVTLEVNGVVGDGTEFDILDASAATSTGVTLLQIGPGAATTANQSQQHILPDKLIVDVTHADADSITYSVHAIFS